MIVGYARTSTVEQEAGLQAQIRELEAAGCEKVFFEQASAASTSQRNVLKEALNFVREGDTFVITRIDRLARSVPDLLQLVDQICEKQVNFRILTLGMDSSTPTGRMMLTMLAAVAQFEREIMLERQREGIAKAKAEGKFKGRKPLPDAIRQAVISYAEVKGLSKPWIAKKLGIGQASVYRIISEHASQPRH
jgi:DNA invertase Pin-like site-specific DNA recombinase